MSAVLLLGRLDEVGLLAEELVSLVTANGVLDDDGAGTPIFYPKFGLVQRLLCRLVIVTRGAVRILTTY